MVVPDDRPRLQIPRCPDEHVEARLVIHGAGAHAQQRGGQNGGDRLDAQQVVRARDQGGRSVLIAADPAAPQHVPRPLTRNRDDEEHAAAQARLVGPAQAGHGVDNAP